MKPYTLIAVLRIADYAQRMHEDRTRLWRFKTPTNRPQKQVLRQDSTVGVSGYTKESSGSTLGTQNPSLGYTRKLF